jgi:glycosyltransferase involved in cell wall biosynthesis
MKILFCSSYPLDSRLGISKSLMELAATMETMGWHCRLASDTEMCPDRPKGYTIRSTRHFVHSVGRFVDKHAKEFDVVDYDQIALPFPRARFEPSTLLVARSALLNYHLQNIRLPRFGGIRSVAGLVLREPFRAAHRAYNVRLSSRTFASADLINVNNDRDPAELVARGFDERKIAVLPLGLTDARLASFPSVPPPAPTMPRIAFIGTFDARKGGTDFPLIVRAVTKAIPNCKFRLLGSRHLLEKQVLDLFPSDLRCYVEVIPTFAPESLPALLSDCSLGIFPSYVEGFGFAVLEMLAASLPVLAYDVPGPAMMLGGDCLVPRGSARELASRTVDLLNNPEKLRDARAWARKRAHDFTWEQAARSTSHIYAERVAELRNPATGASVSANVQPSRTR